MSSINSEQFQQLISGIANLVNQQQALTTAIGNTGNAGESDG